MMRYFFKVITLAVLVTLSAGSADAYIPTVSQANSTQSKVAVRPEDLPEAVKTTLSGDGYADWKVTSAYLVTRENNAQYYEINLRKADETSTLNLDKYGRKVD